jgi:hypothetical protein
MSHLNPEALARLVDEQPTHAEAAHLASCETCRTDLDAMREDVHALAMLPDMVSAPDAWVALEARLLDEGLMRRRTPAFPASRYAQIAAAVVVFVAGTAAGRLTADPDPALLAQLEQATSQAAAAGSAPQLTAPTHFAQDAPAADVLPDAPQPEVRPAPVLPRQSPLTLASTGTLPQPGTMDEAAAMLRQMEEWYLAALTRYAELSTRSDANDPIARLAALQSIVMTTQAALSQTPSDPVINGAHLTAVAQRDAALRHVAATTGDRWH